MGIILNKQIIASNGGMNTSIYDPQNKQIDIYNYADERNFIIKIGNPDEGVSVGNSQEEKARNKIISPEGLSLKGLYNKINDNQNIILELICAPMGDFGIEHRLNLTYYSMDEYGGNGGVGFKFSNDYFEAEMITDDYIYVWRKQEPLYELPEEIGVQPPDWNQNDEMALDYIKNRPFYDGVSKQVVEVDGNSLENQTLTFTNGYIGEFLQQLFGIYDVGFGEVGTKYYVVWDGVEYDCVCFANGDEFPTIGGIENGCPFMFVYYDWWIMRAYSYDSNGNEEVGTTTHTVSVYVESESIVKIPEKYLPDTVATKQYVEDSNIQADWLQNNPSAPDYIKGKMGGFYETIYFTVANVSAYRGNGTSMIFDYDSVQETVINSMKDNAANNKNVKYYMVLKNSWQYTLLKFNSNSTSITLGGEGCPFLFEYNIDSNSFSANFLDDSENIIFVLATEGKRMVPFPEECIPPTFSTKEYVDTSIQTAIGAAMEAIY